MHIRNAMVAATALICAQAPAHAAKIIGEISFSGFVSPIGSTKLSDATGLDFLDIWIGGPTPGRLLNYAGSSGIFAGAVCIDAGGACGAIKDLPDFSVGPISEFVNLSDTLFFDLTSITSITRDPADPASSLKIVADGYFRINNNPFWETTAAKLSLTTQGSGFTTFSATALSSAVPEPANWAMMILGMGLVGGVLRYGRKSVRVGYARS